MSVSAGEGFVSETSMLDVFRKSFSFESWFDSLRGTLDTDKSIRRLVLESLSDASAEQFLNPLVASNLRRFGGELASRVAPERVFWVRSEWEKVDLSYGLAEHFKPTSRGWNAAWVRGKTGDFGQCEVKVCYTHLHAGKLAILAGQLEERRERDRIRGAHHFDRQKYYGLVWLFEHGDLNEMKEVGPKLEQEAKKLGLLVCRSFACPEMADDLGRLWPAEDGGSYRCRMAIALLELAT